MWINIFVNIWQGSVILLNTCCVWQEWRARMPAHLVLPTLSDVSRSRWEDLKRVSWGPHIKDRLQPQPQFCPMPTQYQDIECMLLWRWSPVCVEDAQWPFSHWGTTASMCIKGSVWSYGLFILDRCHVPNQTFLHTPFDLSALDNQLSNKCSFRNWSADGPKSTPRNWKGS